MHGQDASKHTTHPMRDGLEGSTGSMTAILPGRQKDQSRVAGTLQGRCEDGTTQCGEILDGTSDWLACQSVSTSRRVSSVQGCRECVGRVVQSLL